MTVLGVIPARYGSTRFPGKPLVSLQGRPLIEWVIESAQKSRKISQLIVATDDQRIADVAKKSAVMVVMTDPHLPSGTDRIFAATREIVADLLINIQGDEPLISADHIDQLAEAFEKEESLDMATLGHPLSAEEAQSPHAVKVVLDRFQNALYFSRFGIPYSRQSWTEAGTDDSVLKHIGMYAYRPAFLAQFCQAPPAFLERAEALEQLRALHLGAKIKVIKVDSAYPGVDTPEDLEKISRILEARRKR